MEMGGRDPPKNGGRKGGIPAVEGENPGQERNSRMDRRIIDHDRVAGESLKEYGRYPAISKLVLPGRSEFLIRKGKHPDG